MRARRRSLPRGARAAGRIVKVLGAFGSVNLFLVCLLISFASCGAKVADESSGNTACELPSSVGGKGVEMFGDSTLTLRADGNYRSRVYFDANRDRGVAAFANTVSSGASWIVNSRAALRHLKISGVDAEFAVWGRNITNDRYISTVFDSPAQAGSVSGYTNQPRTYGATVRYKF